MNSYIRRTCNIQYTVFRYGAVKCYISFVLGVILCALIYCFVHLVCISCLHTSRISSLLTKCILHFNHLHAGILIVNARTSTFIPFWYAKTSILFGYKIRIYIFCEHMPLLHFCEVIYLPLVKSYQVMIPFDCLYMSLWLCCPSA